MSDNEENDNENNSEECEPSKLPKPGSVDHYFNKIDSNPKFIQLQAKFKPDPNNKNTKFTYKTNAGSFSRKNLTSNSKLKFQAKEGKTKISVNMKMFNTSWEKSPKSDKEGPLEKREPKEELKELAEKQVQQNKEDETKLVKAASVTASKLSNTNSSSNSSSKASNSNSGDLDISFSTSYNNSRLNLRVKDHGQLDAKFTQTFELIPNTLKSKAEYLYEYKNMQHIHKGTFDFTLSTRLQKWIQKVQTQQPDQQFQYFYSKNETKFKARFNSHDSQLKLNTIAHFGSLENVDPIAILPENVSGKQEKVFVSYLEKGQQENAQRLAYLSSVDQDLRTKVEIENKLTVPHRTVGDFNLKSVFKFEQVEAKKLYKIDTIVNHQGIHNIEGRHVWKFIPGHVLGCMVGINWNSHSSQWHKKWQIVFEKQGLNKLRKYGLDFSWMGISLNDKTVGLKLQKKLNGSSKAQMTISRKWSSGSWQPNYGFKLNFNW